MCVSSDRIFCAFLGMFVSPDSIPVVGTATELDVRFFWPHLWGCLFLLTASRGDDLIPSPVSPDLRLCGEPEKNSSVWGFGWNDKALFLGRLVTDCFTPKDTFQRAWCLELRCGIRCHTVQIVANTFFAKSHKKI